MDAGLCWERQWQVLIRLPLGNNGEGRGGRGAFMAEDSQSGEEEEEEETKEDFPPQCCSETDWTRRKPVKSESKVSMRQQLACPYCTSQRVCVYIYIYMRK